MDSEINNYLKMDPTNRTPRQSEFEPIMGPHEILMLKICVELRAELSIISQIEKMIGAIGGTLINKIVTLERRLNININDDIIFSSLRDRVTVIWLKFRGNNPDANTPLAQDGRLLALEKVVLGSRSVEQYDVSRRLTALEHEIFGTASSINNILKLISRNYR